MSQNLCLQKLRKLEGTEVYISPWKKIKQDQITLFADATGNHEWGHVDTEKATQEPLGVTTVPEFLLLSHLRFPISLIFKNKNCRSITVWIRYGL